MKTRNRSRLAPMLNAAGLILFFVAFFNFLVFWCVSVSIGGDALSGKVEDGRYYVSSRGKFTEVSRGVWTYSRMHTISVLITHPMGILGGGGLIALAKRCEAAGRKPAAKQART